MLRIHLYKMEICFEETALSYESAKSRVYREFKMEVRELENPRTHSLISVFFVCFFSSFEAVYLITTALLHLLHCPFSSSTFLVSLHTSSSVTKFLSCQYHPPTEIWRKISADFNFHFIGPNVHP